MQKNSKSVEDSVKPYYEIFSSFLRELFGVDKATHTQFLKFDLLVLALESIEKLNENSALYITLALEWIK